MPDNEARDIDLEPSLPFQCHVEVTSNGVEMTMRRLSSTGGLMNLFLTPLVDQDAMANPRSPKSLHSVSKGTQYQSGGG